MSRITTVRRSFLINLLVLVSAVGLLQACGSDKKAPPPVVIDPTGYYGTNGAMLSTATVFADATPVIITDLQGMISNGRLIMMSVAQNLSYDGNITVSGNSYTGSVTVYQNRAKVSTTPVPVSGTIVQGVSVTGTLAGTGAGNGTFTLTYADASPVDSSMLINANFSWPSVAGNTNYPSIDLPATADFAVGAPATAGVFSSCSFDGVINPIPQTHLYTVNVNASFCFDPAVSLTAAYSGFASLRRTTLSNDTLVLTITNGTYSLSWEFNRP